MKAHTSLSLTLVFTLVLWSCQSDKQEVNNDNNSLPKISIDFGQAQKMKYSDFIESYHFLPLKTDSSTLIGSISKVMTSKDKIFVLDSRSAKSLFAFDRKGNLLHQVGKRGDAPGAYSAAIDFSLDLNKNQILVLDAKGVLLYYNLDDGKFLEQKPLKNFSASYLAALNSERIAWIDAGGSHNLLISSANLEPEDKFFPYTRREMEVLPIYPLQTLGQKEGYLYRRDFNDTIFKIGKNASPEPYAYIDYQEGKLGKAEYERLLKAQNPESMFADFALTQGVYVSKDYCFITSFYRKMPYISVYRFEDANTVTADFGRLNNDVSFDRQASYVVGTDTEKSDFIFYVDLDSFSEGIEKATPSEDSHYKYALDFSKNPENMRNPFLMMAKLKVK